MCARGCVCVCVCEEMDVRVGGWMAGGMGVSDVSGLGMGVRVGRWVVSLWLGNGCELCACESG